MTFKRFMVLLLLACIVFSTTPQAISASSKLEDHSAFEILQAADVLGVKAELLRFRDLQAGSQENFENEALSLRTLLLRKILLGFVQVRQASNKTDIELTYTYDVLYREQRKLAKVLQLFNLINFTQLSIFYTIEPYSRMNKQFIQSSVLGEIRANIGSGLSVLSILYGKFFKASNIQPPKFLENSLEGNPVDGSGLPVYVSKFLDSPEAGETKSRKEKMFEYWAKTYGVDPTKKESLYAINDNKSRSLGWLNKRIVLLWSLRNQIQKFDYSLLAMCRACKSTPPTGGGFETAVLSVKAREAAQLLQVETLVAELSEINRKQVKDKRRLELEAALLEQVLVGLLEVRIATDKIDQELSFNYDIALSDLLSKRSSALQKNFEANFIQTGAAVAIAKYLFLKHYAVAANEMLVITGGMGTGLSALALYLGRGGKRQVGQYPNSLADFLDLDPANFHFSPLMTAFLNTPSDESEDGKSKKEELLHIWKREKIGGMNHPSQKTKVKLAGLPQAKYDRIGTIKKRIDLLFSLKINLEFFDKDLLALMQETGFAQAWATDEHSAALSQTVTAGLTPHAAEAARLLEIRTPVKGLGSTSRVQDLNKLDNELSLTRKVMQGLLDLRVTADKLEFEIVKEEEVRDRMVKNRDMGIAVTNNANFFQLGILGIIGSGPLALSGQKRYRHYGDVVNYISGLLTAGFTAASALQQKVEFRPSAAEPNMLGQVLGLETDPSLKYSPLIWKFLNSVSPASTTGLTRREQLIEYWHQQKSLSGKGVDKSAAEKLSASGPAHHWWCETLKLVNRRLNMLYIMHATVDLLERELSELLMAAEI